MAVVFLPATIRNRVGAESVRCGAATVWEAIQQVDARVGELAETLCDGDQLRDGWAVVIDQTVAPAGLQAKLGPDSEVHFVAAIGGG